MLVPKPYYEDTGSGIVLYHGDCRDVLPTLPANSVDVLIADPPYGVGWRSNNRAESFDRIIGDDGSLDVPSLLALALKPMKRHHHAYVFGRFDLAGLPLSSPVELIWDKGGPGLGDLSLPWGPAHETITFGVYEFSKANRAKGYGALAARLRRSSVIRCTRLQSGQVSRHPTEKPVLLLRQLIESSSVIGDTVLDPFAGSGSTLEAARLEGRRAVGVEIDERYCEIAAKRLSQSVLPLEVA